MIIRYSFGGHPTTSMEINFFFSFPNNVRERPVDLAWAQNT